MVIWGSTACLVAWLVVAHVGEVLGLDDETCGGTEGTCSNNKPKFLLQLPKSKPSLPHERLGVKLPKILVNFSKNAPHERALVQLAGVAQISDIANKRTEVVEGKFRTKEGKCDQFMKDASRDLNDYATGEIFGGGGTSMVLGLFGAITESKALEATGGVIGVGSGLVSEYFFPDPDEKRIKLLQDGMECIWGEVERLEEDMKRLERDVKNIQERVDETILFPLAEALEDVEHDFRHVVFPCTRMMRCVSDAKWLRKVKGWKNDEGVCEKHPLFSYKRIPQCDAKKFESWLQDGSLQQFSSLRAHQKTRDELEKIITKKESNMYTAARGILQAYTDAIGYVVSIWLALEEWAQAICQPYGKWNPCEKTDWEAIDLGFQKFNTSADGFRDEIEKLAGLLTKAEFEDIRKNITRESTAEENSGMYAHYTWFKNSTYTITSTAPEQLGHGLKQSEHNCTIMPKVTVKRDCNLGGIASTKKRKMIPLSDSCNENLDEFLMNNFCEYQPCHLGFKDVYGAKYKDCNLDSPCYWKLDSEGYITEGKVDDCGWITKEKGNPCAYTPGAAIPGPDCEEEEKMTWTLYYEPLVFKVEEFEIAHAKLKKHTTIGKPYKESGPDWEEPTTDAELSRAFRKLEI